MYEPLLTYPEIMAFHDTTSQSGTRSKNSLARAISLKDGNGSDMHGNGFGYPSFYFLLVSIP